MKKSFLGKRIVACVMIMALLVTLLPAELVYATQEENVEVISEMEIAEAMQENEIAEEVSETEMEVDTAIELESEQYFELETELESETESEQESESEQASEAETELDIRIVLSTYCIQSATFWDLVILSLFNQEKKIKAERI